MTELTVGIARNGPMRYVLEDPRNPRCGHGPIVTKYLTERPWDVTDPKARAAAAREELGEEVDEHWSKHAQWFINPEKNAAALCVYRPKAKELVA